MHRIIAVVLALLIAAACGSDRPAGLPRGDGGSGGTGDASMGGSGGEVAPEPLPIWAQGWDRLYRLDRETLEVAEEHTFVFPEDEPPVAIMDVACSRRGVLLALAAGGAVYRVDPATGALTPRASLAVGGNSLGFATGPDGKETLIVGRQDGVVFRAQADGTVQEIGSFPGGLSGDVAWAPGVGLLSSVRVVDDDWIAALDLATGSSRLLGPVGRPHVYGLALRGDVILGFTDDGSVLRLDPVTGGGTVVASIGVAFWGAASADASASP